MISKFDEIYHSIIICLVPNVDLPPLCSSRFRPGPPGEQAQACSQFIAELIERFDGFCIFGLLTQGLF